jgi:acetyltransferase-like isoleucine patch superfamily enzyme
MSLGEAVIIHRDCWITIAAGSRPKGIKLIIGSHCGIGMGATIAAAQQVVLGEHVLLARNVYIADHGHAFSDPSRPIMDQGIDSIQPVSIGKNSWLGQNVVVLPGVAIGEHCVIGANSVVNRSVPDFSVAVGSPARVVKRFNRQKNLWEKCA